METLRPALRDQYDPLERCEIISYCNCDANYWHLDCSTTPNTNEKGDNMSKKLFLCSMILLAALGQVAVAGPWDNGPGRPGRPGRPGDDRPGPGRPPIQRVEYVVLQTFRVEKLIETTTNIRVNMPNVKTIQFAAKSNSVEIVEARAQLDNGREIYMDGITGGLRDGRSVIYTLDRSERVRSITVRAVTSGLIGSRADLEVSVGVLR
jgi:hypothetical protein